jgi:hypothetical protein
MENIKPKITIRKTAFGQNVHIEVFGEKISIARDGTNGNIEVGLPTGISVLWFRDAKAEIWEDVPTDVFNTRANKKAREQLEKIQEVFALISGNED